MKKHKVGLECRSVNAQGVQACRFELKAVADDGSIEGYGSVFNNADAYDDVIVEGAFAASLARHKAAGTNPAMLWQHDTAAPIGVWIEMREDPRGLFVKGRLALDTVRGKEAHSLMKMGALNGLSIGFKGEQWVYDKGSDIRILSEIDLWEVSLVTFPANTLARVTNVKAGDFEGINTIREVERKLRDAGLPSQTAVAAIATVKRIAATERDARDAVAHASKAADRLLSSLNQESSK
jgi:HK97 family phage prohead protease